MVEKIDLGNYNYDQLFELFSKYFPLKSEQAAAKAAAEEKALAEQHQNPEFEAAQKEHRPQIARAGGGAQKAQPFKIARDNAAPIDYSRAKPAGADNVREGFQITTDDSIFRQYTILLFLLPLLFVILYIVLFNRSLLKRLLQSTGLKPTVIGERDPNV